jgi:hypothetical protein
MARTISVKVPVATLIANIENKIAEIDAAIANYPAEREAYDKANEAYKAKVAEFVAGFVANNIDKIGYDYDDTIRLMTRGSVVELEFKTDAIAGFPQKPVEPNRPNQNTYYGRDYVTPKSILEKNLRILQMTSQEEVNASTYGAIMEIL